MTAGHGALAADFGNSRWRRRFHWALALALSCQYALGWWMQTVPKAPPGLRAGWFNLHKSIGITLLACVLAWLFWRVRQRAHSLEGLPPWQQWAARANHGLLYGLMVALPLTGYLGSSFTRYPIRYFGLEIPTWHRDWPAAKELMSALHWGAAWVLAAALALHVAAGLWHWRQGHAVARRMGLRRTGQ